MNDLAWGLMMMAVGMGTVFLLLAALMAVLIGMGRLDRTPAPAQAPAAPERAPGPAVDETGPGKTGVRPAPTVRIVADGLDENQVAAIAIAVITHAENRRRLAAPETRLHAPGSQLFASRWLAAGRARQNTTFRRK